MHVWFSSKQTGGPNFNILFSHSLAFHFPRFSPHCLAALVAWALSPGTLGQKDSGPPLHCYNCGCPQSKANKKWVNRSVQVTCSKILFTSKICPPLFVSRGSCFVFCSQFIAVIHRKISLLGIFTNLWFLLCLGSVTIISLIPGLYSGAHTTLCMYSQPPLDCLLNYMTAIFPKCNCDPVRTLLKILQ